MKRFQSIIAQSAAITGACLTVVGAAGADSAVAGDRSWPHARGPGMDGTLTAARVFGGPETPDSVSLDLAWQAPIGPGYSGIVVAGTRAVTMFSHGDGDWIAAFDAATGRRLWRHRLGDRYVGEDGSTDGPLSSPLIHGERVFAFAPRGRFVALGLDDGKVVWSRALGKELGAPKPSFGFTSTPLSHAGLVILQLGGSEGRSIIGMDAASGELRFSYGDNAVEYQSPTIMKLAGRAQVVAASGDALLALDPESGKLLWRHPVENGTSGSAVPTFIGDDRFLVRAGGGIAAYRVMRDGEIFSVAALYRSNTLGRSYAPPVYFDGHVYGFRGQILTCMKADDGSRVWRSRPPGGEGLILVDGHLVIFASGGNVVVAEASPAGYREVARHRALAGSALSWPSFADGRVFVRNLEQLAAVSITRGATRKAATTGRDQPADDQKAADDHSFGRWLTRLAAADDRRAEIEAFVRQHPQWPIIDGEHVTFLFRSEANEVGIAGSMLDSGLAEPMTRLADTDLFYRTFRLQPGLRWEYRFQVDFEDWHGDPRNPRTVPAVSGHDFSELVSDGYPLARHIETEPKQRGQLETLSLESKILDSTKEVVVWLPPGYGDDASRRYPLLVVNEGPAWREKGLLTRSLDNLVGDSVAPMVVAFVEPSRAWWEESGGSRADDYLQMQADELVPMLEQRYRLRKTPSDRAMLGSRYYGSCAIYAALKRPDVFGRAALLSPNLEHGVRATIFQHIRQGDAKNAVLYLDWNRFDERRRDRGYDFGQEAETLAEKLRAGGYTFAGGEIADSSGWGGWRGRADRFLTALFPIR